MFTVILPTPLLITLLLHTLTAASPTPQSAGAASPDPGHTIDWFNYSRPRNLPDCTDLTYPAIDTYADAVRIACALLLADLPQNTLTVPTGWTKNVTVDAPSFAVQPGILTTAGPLVNKTLNFAINTPNPKYKHVQLDAGLCEKGFLVPHALQDQQKEGLICWANGTNMLLHSEIIVRGWNWAATGRGFSTSHFHMFVEDPKEVGKTEKVH